MNGVGGLWCSRCQDGPFNDLGLSCHLRYCGTAAPPCGRPSISRYVKGCRCQECRRCSREHHRRWRAKAAA